MKIIFADLNKDVTIGLTHYFGDIADIYNDDIFNYKADAILSPYNSFGFMDGGIDYVYSQYFGGDLQKRLKEAINQYFHRELLVGLALAIETNNDMVAAYQMRIAYEEVINNKPIIYNTLMEALGYKQILKGTTSVK